MSKAMAVKELERKITRIGNSLGVTFPHEVLKHLDLKKGDTISFDISDGEVTIKKFKELTLPEGIDNEFLENVGEMIEEYNETFKGLANR